jgi:acetoacetyl-CoA synthetase
MAAVEPLWTPTSQRIAAAAITRFTRAVRPDLAGAGYAALHEWSVNEREEFWSALWDFAGIVGDKGAAPYLVDGDRLPGSRWFPRARLNYAENLLWRRDDGVALVGLLENGKRGTLTYGELYLRVAQLAAALRREGVAPGDRVAGYLPNVIDAVVAMLASSSVGAVWSSCSPDFGLQGMLDRFGQIEPKLLFTADGYYYNGTRHASLPRVAEAAKHLPSVQRVVVIPVLEDTPDLNGLPSAVLIDDYLDKGATACEFNRLPFDHPLFIMYTSGTTGKPKCIVHGAGGALLEHQKEHLLHTDLGAGDRFLYFTTCGWMMWNWMVSALACGCTLIVYDGSPGYPQADSLLGIAEQESLTVFGTSARYISMLDKEGARPAEHYDLSSLKTILSTGSPLSAEAFRYVYEHIKQDVLLSSISGGTDLLGAFVSGHPCLPVYAGELQCRGLALDVDVVDDDGLPVRGQKGELICRQSFPSVPTGFWNDPDGERFHEAYFARFPNVWTHGDYAELTLHDGMIIHGRSDALLNPGGVRIGTAEIYRQVEKIPEVVESVVVGQDWGDDCRVILFVRLQEGLRLDSELATAIRQMIRSNASPRHVPAQIIQVTDIPRTRSGKIAEIAVRKAIHEEPVSNTEALANPESLAQFRKLQQLSG